jgi:hypothetical protein
MISTSLNAIVTNTPEGKCLAYCAQMPTITGFGDTEYEAMDMFFRNANVDIIALRNDAILQENKKGRPFKVVSFETTISQESPMTTPSDNDDDLDRKARLMQKYIEAKDEPQALAEFMDGIKRPCEVDFIKKVISNPLSEEVAQEIKRHSLLFPKKIK